MYPKAACDLCIVTLSLFSLSHPDTFTMMFVPVLLLLCLSCSAAADGEVEVKEACTKQLGSAQPDVWAEVRGLRDLVVEQRAELNMLKTRLTSAESELQELRGELQTLRTNTGNTLSTSPGPDSLIY